MSSAVEARKERDRKLGSRIRTRWNKIITQAKAAGLSESQVRGFVVGGGLTADTAGRKKLAKGLGFDWEGAAQFFVTIMPIIEEMMAACG